MCVADKSGDTVAVPPELKVSGKSYDADVLAPEDEWIAKLDHEAFKEDIRSLGKELAANQGPEDVAHLKKIIGWSRACSMIGMLTMAYCINPISIYLISIGTMTRWAIIGHHICHGGFDRCSNGEYNRFKFAVGGLYRRVVDWLDWMLVEAWNVEHNQLHHYCLGELADPDLVENNLHAMREEKKPLWVKYTAVGFFMATWKWFYYAPNTFKMLKVHEMRRKGQTPRFKSGRKKGQEVPENVLTAPWVISSSWIRYGALFYDASEFFVRVLGPFFVRQFILIPLLCGLVGGRSAWYNALVSMVLAEALTNIHSFVVIVTNHAGDDLYRFERHCTARSSTFYLRQVISSVNFHMGTDLIDFHHGWLNYQVEHHLWPDLSMLSYQRAAPLVKGICKKHGVPYLQQNVFWRVKKTADIMVGAASMRKFPAKWEHEPDLTPLDEPLKDK